MPAGAYLGNIKEYALVGSGSPHGVEKDKKKTLWGTQGAKPPEENSCRAFLSTNLPPSCTHVCFGVHAVIDGMFPSVFS